MQAGEERAILFHIRTASDDVAPEDIPPPVRSMSPVPDDLLGTAALLAEVEDGPGRPSPTDLRRAVSTAYHALTEREAGTVRAMRLALGALHIAKERSP